MMVLTIKVIMFPNYVDLLKRLRIDATGKLKGSIYCAGLSAYEFSADDVICRT